ncbi:MAG: hypothetical protein JO061_04690, partial [Acidobacteriaceae bacterium]|nr:hypothetical protein [Acidobacteriaceae bacterium]
NVSLITGTPQLVTLSVAGVPVGMNYTISPNPADPSYTSVLTFIAGTSTLAGEYNLTIIAAGGEVTRTATFGLYVEYPAQ